MKERTGSAPPHHADPRHAWQAPEPGNGATPWREERRKRRRGRRLLWRYGRSLLPRGLRGSGPLRRVLENGRIGGVAAGLSARTGLDVTVVRVVFVLAALASGFGAAAYVVAWLLVPAAGGDSNIASKAAADRRGIAQAAGVVSVLVVVLLIASAFGAGWLGSLAWPLGIAVAGLVLIWRNAPEDEQAIVRQLAEPFIGWSAEHKRPWMVLRLSAASLLLFGGIGVLLSGRHPSGAVARPLGGVSLVIAAIVMVLGPWWLRIARDLVIERQARARAEERADMAARVHDSVLQTLALIQRRAGDPGQVVQLARAQERELRAWLFEGQAPGSADGTDRTLVAGVQRIQRDVEAQHQIAVEIVTVGDCGLDQDLSALLAAAREAAVNAAKWSGADVISLFAEVEPASVSLFVRDRGRGFDPGAVPPDRKGLAESIHARMARRGGTATVRSRLGEGTEVSLTMPRNGERQPSRA